MRDLLLVGGGGFAGSVARYLLSGYAATLTAALTSASAGSVGRFPVGTLVVNVLGCALIGVLAGIAQHVGPWSASARLFLFTGLLGGFTTFSAFGYETFELARAGAWPMAALNMAAQLVGGLFAVWLGFRLVSIVHG